MSFDLTYGLLSRRPRRRAIGMPIGYTHQCPTCDGSGWVVIGHQFVDDTHREPVTDRCLACGGEAVTCSACNGSGLGRYDGTDCVVCQATGLLSPEARR